MNDFQLTLPLIVPAFGALAVLLLRPRTGVGGNPLAARIAVLASLVSILVAMWLRPADGKAVHAMSGFLLLDPLGLTAVVLCATTTVVTAMLAPDWLKKADANHAEFYALLLFCLAGMTVMVTSDNLVSIFLGLELMSLGLYVLSSFTRQRQKTVEAGAKYFLAGAFASGLVLMGIALCYGAGGSFDVAAMGASLAHQNDHQNVLAKAGAVFILAGLAFKLALVPFHQWAPDVYEGAPTPITGYMSTAVKVAAYTAVFRIAVNSGATGFLHGSLVGFAIATMVVGNVGALAQTSVKRMLAYSSIAHAGYLLLGPIAAVRGSDRAIEAVVFYLAAYALTNLVAFGVLSWLETREGTGLTFDDLAGLRWRYPASAMCLCIAMLSLAGVPPMAGFLGKFMLFGAVVDRARATGDPTYWLLVAVAILTSLVSLAYYLRVIAVMYLREPVGAPLPLPRFSFGYRLALTGLAGLVIWLGFGPTAFGIGADGLIAFVKHAVAGNSG